jgi:hypothetical protein
VRTWAVVVSLACALTAAGCSEDEPSPPPRTATIESLAALCDAALADIEALGLPAEVGIEVVKPWALRGTRMARDIGRLEGGTVEEQTQLEALSGELKEYYAGLLLGYTIYKKSKSSDLYMASLERATTFLVSAEKRATALGAPECATRPFADYVPAS